MELDYKAIGTRIAQRRKQLGLKQSEVEEAADIGFKYLSNIERGISIPSTEVIMRLGEEGWKDIAELLRPMKGKQLDLAKNFLTWLSEQDLEQ